MGKKKAGSHGRGKQSTKALPEMEAKNKIILTVRGTEAQRQTLQLRAATAGRSLNGYAIEVLGIDGVAGNRR